MSKSIDVKHFKFKHPFTCMVAGPTSSGKTVFVQSLLKEMDFLIDGIREVPKIVWCYGQWQSSYSQPCGETKVEYVEGLLAEESIRTEAPDVMIIDDLMNELGDDKRLADLFTKGSHHLNISLIFIVQNVFHKAKQMRTISLNCHYMVLMKNPRDKSQIFSLARQLYPNKMKFLIEAYEDATKEPFSYIKIDLTPSTPEKYRITSNIFSKNSVHEIVTYQMK